MSKIGEKPIVRRYMVATMDKSTYLLSSKVGQKTGDPIGRYRFKISLNSSKMHHGRTTHLRELLYV